MKSNMKYLGSLGAAALTVLSLGAGSSMAEIKVNDNLGISGFLDMSAYGAIPDSGDATLDASVDQYEIDFMYTFGTISARADVNAIGNSGPVTLEQGNVSISINGLGLTVGKFLSSSGFEAAEPTGLYQYSTSKYTTTIYGGYQNGLAVNYGSDMWGIYASMVTDVWSGSETELMKSPGFEGQISLMPMEGVTVKATYLFQMYDKDTSPIQDENQSLLNVWASYATGPVTVAAEFNMMMSWTAPDSLKYPGTYKTANDEGGIAYLAMANYKITDKIAATVRYSALKYENADDTDNEITFSPSYLISDNWTTLAEVKYEILNKTTNYAVESLFSF